MQKNLQQRAELLNALPRTVASARLGNAEALADLHNKIDNGLFDVSLSAFPEDQSKQLWYVDVLTAEKPLYDAFFNAYEEARFETVHGEPGYPAFPVPLQVTLPHSAPEMASIMAKVFDALVTQDLALDKRNVDLSSSIDRPELFAKAMSMACIMDLPEAIGPLAMRCPQSMRHPLWIRDAWSQHMQHETHMATPAFFAVQYGNPECIDALRNAGLERQFSLTHHWIGGLDGARPNPQHEFFSCISLSILPSQLPAVLERMDHRAQRNNPGMSAMRCSTELSIPASLRSFLPVFMDAGTLDRIPKADVLKAACEENIGEVVDRYKDAAPWEEMNSGLIVSVSRAGGGSTHEAALVALLKEAQAQGQNHMLKPYESCDLCMSDDLEISVMEPAYSVIKAGMKDTLVLLMRNGLKPNEKDVFGSSPMDVALQTNRPEMAHVMKTFMARQTVRGVLDEIEALDAQTATRKNTGTSP